MSEVKLEDLLEMNAAPAAAADPARPDLAPAQVVTAVTQQVEEIIDCKFCAALFDLVS